MTITKTTVADEHQLIQLGSTFGQLFIHPYLYEWVAVDSALLIHSPRFSFNIQELDSPLLICTTYTCRVWNVQGLSATFRPIDQKGMARPYVIACADMECQGLCYIHTYTHSTMNCSYGRVGRTLTYSKSPEKQFINDVSLRTIWILRMSCYAYFIANFERLFLFQNY